MTESTSMVWPAVGSRTAKEQLNHWAYTDLSAVVILNMLNFIRNAAASANQRPLNGTLFARKKQWPPVTITVGTCYYGPAPP